MFVKMFIMLQKLREWYQVGHKFIAKLRECYQVGHKFIATYVAPLSS